VYVACVRVSRACMCVYVACVRVSRVYVRACVCLRVRAYVSVLVSACTCAQDHTCISYPVASPLMLTVTLVSIDPGFIEVREYVLKPEGMADYLKLTEEYADVRKALLPFLGCAAVLKGMVRCCFTQAMLIWKPCCATGINEAPRHLLQHCCLLLGCT